MQRRVYVRREIRRQLRLYRHYPRALMGMAYALGGVLLRQQYGQIVREFQFSALVYMMVGQGMGKDLEAHVRKHAKEARRVSNPGHRVDRTAAEARQGYDHGRVQEV